MRAYNLSLNFFFFHFQAVDLLKRFLVYHSKVRISAAKVSISKKVKPIEAKTAATYSLSFLEETDFFSYFGRVPPATRATDSCYTVVYYIHTEIYTLKSRRVNFRSQTDVNQSNVAYRFSHM